MAVLVIERSICAPAALVFGVISHPERFAEAIGGVTKLDFLTDTTSGMGTRFRQTRLMNGKEQTMEFEVTEFVSGERVRILNETHGVFWDSLFSIVSQGPESKLSMRMETKTRRFLPRLLLPIMVPLFVKKPVAKDFDRLKEFCEKASL